MAAVDGVTPVRIHMLNTGEVSMVHRSANGEIEGVGTLRTARKRFDGKVFSSADAGGPLGLPNLPVAASQASCKVTSMRLLRAASRASAVDGDPRGYRP